MENKPVGERAKTVAELKVEIIKYLKAHVGKKYKATSLVNALYLTHASDSNSPQYRRLLRALNELWEMGVIKAHQQNRYMAIRWWIEEDK